MITTDTNDRIDVTESGYTTGEVSVSTSQIEAKVGASRLSGRQSLILYNKGPGKVYYGPTGLTASSGMPLIKSQKIKYMIGDMAVFLISETSASVVVQELA